MLKKMSFLYRRPSSAPMRRLTCLLALAASAITVALVPVSAQAQLRVEIAGVGAQQIPVAIASFANETIAPQKVTAIIKADLARSGMFKIIDTGDILSENATINYADWKARGADALVIGSVQQLADGRYDIRYRLLDTLKSAQLSALSMSAQSPQLRLSAHKIADDIYQKLTGIPGIFSTRIAYVTKAAREYRLEVADADGEGIQVALRSGEPIISPTWSPDGTKVAYVSFEARKPVIYIQNLVTRQRTVAANFKGSNSAPSWSPDGSHLAVALTRDGLTQIYSIEADGSNVQRLTRSNGIDTEPRYAPNGSIYFTSDRSGGPQIYKMGPNGGEAQRITFTGTYNTSPRISADGKLLAYISRREGKYQLYLLDLTNNQELRLSDTARDESPSFSANGKYVMYSNGNGLSVVSVDGQVKQRLTTQAGNIREPTWGPFMK